MYKVTEQDPILGRIEWTIRDCKDCSASGRLWYQGCDDRDVGCPRCDGQGEIATARQIPFESSPTTPNTEITE